MKKLLVMLVASAFAFNAFAQAQKAEPAAPKGQTGVETKKAEPATPAKADKKGTKTKAKAKSKAKSGEAKAKSDTTKSEVKK
jgi:Ni/Co efflux regulator RcnB